MDSTERGHRVLGDGVLEELAGRGPRSVHCKELC